MHYLLQLFYNYSFVSLGHPNAVFVYSSGTMWHNLFAMFVIQVGGCYINV